MSQALDKFVFLAQIPNIEYIIRTLFLMLGKFLCRRSDRDAFYLGWTFLFVFVILTFPMYPLKQHCLEFMDVYM